MKKTDILMLISLLLIPACSFAEGTRLISNTLLRYELPSDRWQVATEAPQLAIDAMYDDLVFGKKQKGEDFDPEKLRTMAVKFVQTNNLYIYNEQTEAYLMISISSYNEETGPPGKKAILGSAQWAVDAISEHADVKDLSPYKSSIERVDIPGMKYAVKVDSNYPLFGEPHHFIGIIGYSHPYWAFLYYNDKVKNTQDLTEMRRLLDSIKFDKM